MSVLQYIQFLLYHHTTVLPYHYMLVSRGSQNQKVGFVCLTLIFPREVIIGLTYLLRKKDLLS